MAAKLEKRLSSSGREILLHDSTSAGGHDLEADMLGLSASNLAGDGGKVVTELQNAQESVSALLEVVKSLQASQGSFEYALAVLQPMFQQATSRGIVFPPFVLAVVVARQVAELWEK